jgi:DNA mismatch endonuclease, patch repair protein
MDRISVSRRSANMRAIRSTDSKPERAVRRLVHGMGYRYRLHVKDIPGKPDLVFRPRRKVIFVHGCFWHQHRKADCADGRTPRSRLDYWRPKLERNRERDKNARKALKKSGWRVLIIWECETHDEAHLKRRLTAFLN